MRSDPKCLLVMIGMAVAGCPGPTERHEAALDPREPVVLEPPAVRAHHEKMAGFLDAVESIVGGVAAEDWARVDTAAARLGRAGACNEPVASVEPYLAMSLAFRCTASGLEEPVRARDARAVLAKTAETLAVCNACHAGFRIQVRG